MAIKANKEKQIKRILVLVFTRGVAIVCQFAFQILLARLLGAQGMGLFQLFITWLSTLGEVATLGRPANIMRYLSQMTPKHTRQSVFTFIRKSIMLVALFSVCLSIVIYASLNRLHITLSTSLQQVFSWLSLFLLAYALMRVFSESLKALGKTKLAVFLETGLIPCIMLLVLGFQQFSKQAITISHIVIVYGSIYYVIALAMALVLYAKVKTTTNNNATQHLEASPKDKLFSLTGDALLSIVFVYFPILFMPLYASLSEVGITSAALRYIGLATTLLIVLASWFGPRFSKAYASGQQGTTRQLLWQSQLYSLGLYLPFFLLFIVFTKPLLAIFGDEFIEASGYLVILAFAQLINAATGLPGVLLKMMGKAHIEFTILLCTITLGLALLPWLGTKYGALGVISIFAATIIIKNCFSLMFAYRLLTRQHVYTMDKT